MAFQFVTLVSQGGTPVRLANVDGSPFPTTGTGSLVFSEGPTINNATLSHATLEQPLINDPTITNFELVDPEILGTVTGGATYASITLTSPTLSGTVSGAVEWNDRQTFTSLAETSNTVSIFAGALSLNALTGTVFVVTVDADFTFSIFNMPTTGAVTVYFVGNGSSHTPTWGSAVKWAGGVAPVLSTGSGHVDIITFTTHNGGTTLYGFVGGQDFA